MKIAVAIPRAESSLYIQNALMSMGHKVATYDYRHYTDHKRLRELAGRADALVIVKGETISPEIIRLCSKQTPTAMWHFDAWEAREEWVLERAQAVDHFFTIAGGLVKWYEEQGVEAHWLSQGCDPELSRPIGHFTDFDRAWWGSDVAFIGTIVDKRGPLLEEIGKKFDLKVWGSYEYGDKGYKVNHMGRAHGDERHNFVVSSSKINLGMDRTPEIWGSWSARLYKTLAAGGLYLTNETEGLTAYFEDGVDLLLYENQEDCLEVIQSALKHDNWRKEIARIGMHTVRQEHTYRHRMEEMLKWLT